MSEKIKILYIDDEPENLLGFKAMLRVDYNVFIADNIERGIAILDANQDIRIIFCDQRMPDKTGVAFFEKIRVNHPLPVRILLTAYNDIEPIIEAINIGHIFRFVKKPWTEGDIISAIVEANKFYMANSMLAIRNEELQKAYNELNKFAYSVNHDIRGPIAGILGAITVAREIDDLAEMKQMLFLMEKSVKKMDSYVLSMHDYYSLQRGELKIKEIDFNEVVDELNDMYSVIAKVNHVDFKIQLNQESVFRSDYAPLMVVFNNLISNAFKYQKKNSDNKSIEVDIDVSIGVVKITVKDTGIGIVKHHLGNIFNLFYRSNSQEVGSGFGLYNVKSALTKLNGQVEVESELNKGTIFKVTIPSI